MALRLIIEDEEGATTIVPLGEEEITIGREPGNTIQLTEQNVSRQHARLTPGSEGWVIEDLDSYNGVRVNGVLIEGSVTLNEGDVVQIGDYHLAITNNAEQTTLNLDRPGMSGASEALRVAPSVDLPRIPAVEAALLATTPTVAPSTSGAGIVGESESHHADAEPGGKGRGLLVALFLLLVVGGGLVAYQFAGGGSRTDPTPKITKADPGTKAEPAKVPETKVPDKIPEAKVPPPPPDPPPDLPPEPQATTGEPPPTDDDTTTTGPGEEPIKKQPTKKPPTTKVDKGDKGDKTAAPKGDPVQLLEDARKANMAGNATQAYDLAKKSYDIDKNTNALALMGATACKMGDQAKAKAAFKKLSDPTKQKQMITVCAERGIMLE